MKICSKCAELYPDHACFCPHDGAELRKSTDPYLGRTLAARYRLVKRIGAGGMSLVYLARHVMIERLSAIKILRQDLVMHPVHRERFLREARAVNRINHGNIVEITDFGEHEGLVYLVMEYVAGESLLAHIKRGRFAWQRAVRVAIQIVSALARAHQSGVIHRDLKPENVMLVGQGDKETVKLTDFGIAKILDAPALTFSEQLFGTPGYIAPEYVEGLPGDGRADLYSLGVVLYEMATGQLPYDARTQADLLTLPLTTAPIPAGERVPGLPPDLEALLLRLLARRPTDRPRDAVEVYDTLSDVLRRLGGSMRPSAVGDDGDEVTQTERLGQGRFDHGDVAVADVGDAAPQGERLTAEVAAFPTIEIASRWHAAIAEIEASIMRARKRGGRYAPAADRAAALAEGARGMVGSGERASAKAAEHQARVDRLEARGRAFRANLGHAVDALVRDRSRERAHSAAIESRRKALAVARDDTGVTDSAGREALMWEAAALDAEDERARTLEEDLTFQIESLQKQLDAENEQLENELVEARGELEGSLSALRLLTSEIVRTLDEAAAAVTDVARRRS